MGILVPEDRPVIRLPAGTYSLELSDATGELAIATDRVALRRGEEQVVRVVPAALARRTGRRRARRPALGRRSRPWPTNCRGWSPIPRACEPGRAGTGRWQVETRWPRAAVVSLVLEPGRDAAGLRIAGRGVRIYETGGLAPVGAPGRARREGHGRGVVARRQAPGLGAATTRRCASGTRTAPRGRSCGATSSPSGPWRGARTGRDLASASNDATVRIWDVDGTAGAGAVRMRAGRSRRVESRRQAARLGRRRRSSSSGAPTARRARSWRGIAGRSAPWPGAPTAGGWPRRATTRPCGSGTPTARRGRSSRTMPRRSAAWRGAPTAGGSPRRATTRPYGSGAPTARRARS